MKTLIYNIGLLGGILPSGIRMLRGSEMQNRYTTLSRAWLLIDGERISDYGPECGWHDDVAADRYIDACGGAVLPAWCDSHTHIVYAGSREGEFTDKIRGLSYAEIARRGGGILNSADRLHHTSEEELYEQARRRLDDMVNMGSGLIEIKSGYGLNTDDELKMLAEFEAKGGSFLFVCDYIDQKNSKPNYEILLRSYGFVPKKGLVVADVNAPDTYFNSRIYNLIPEICSTDVTIGMLAAGNDLVVLAQTTAFEEPEEADRNLNVETVLRSGETSVLKGSDEGEPTGAFPLALSSAQQFYRRNGRRLRP